MTRYVASAALLGLGGSLIWLTRTSQPLGHELVLQAAWLTYTLSGLLFVLALLLAMPRKASKTTAWWRLDWFLPVLRRTQDPAAQHPLMRVLRRLLPGSLFSDRRTKRRGAVRRLLRGIGTSWLASPVRRVVQACCLVLFLYLFLYVCWPYTARPVGEAVAASGWQLETFDQQTGELMLQRSTSLPWPVVAGDEVFIRSDATRMPGQDSVTRMRVTRATPSALSVHPAGELTPDLLDQLFTNAGTWSVLDRDPQQWPSHYADELARKETIPAEFFLNIDPLVSISTAIASRSWIGSLTSAAVILIVCVLVPRGFCGYLCPLGTTIDLFDWAIAGRVKRFRVSGSGWWVHLKYYLLVGTLVAAFFGVLASGFVAAIPIVTRAALFILEPLQSGTLRGWHLVPSLNFGQFLSIALFLLVLGLGFLSPRFWCKYVCPSGAVFSLGNLFRMTERKVESSCIHCNKCIEICPFDAIKPDFTTRSTDCTLCQSCGGVCPTEAIKFVERWNGVELKVENDPPTGETALGRRGFLSLISGTTAALWGGWSWASFTQARGAEFAADAALPVRPPGSVPEREFLQMCIRCGECYKACPNNVLQPEGFQQGLEGLWAPMVQADWAGCESSCNACGQVCPTGAIRALPLEEKRVARMGLAIVNETTCLPFAQQEACDLCVVECQAAGYHAIEYTRVGTQVDAAGRPIEGTGFLAPIVLPELCVGCGLCQTRCHAIHVKSTGKLASSAIVVAAGQGREDRLMTGSYLKARAQREREQSRTPPPPPPDTGDGFGVEPAAPTPAEDDPFGLSQ